MIKTFTDIYGRTWDTRKLELHWNEEDNITLVDGTYVITRFCELEDVIETLELTDKEIEIFTKECCL